MVIARKGSTLCLKLLTEGNGSDRRKNVKNGIPSVVRSPSHLNFRMLNIEVAGMFTPVWLNQFVPLFLSTDN